MPRPFELDPYFRAISTLPGLGPRLAPLFERLVGGPKVIDALWHKPIDFIDRRFAPKINAAPAGKIATITVTIGRHVPNARKSQPYRIEVSDETGAMSLAFFNPRKKWLDEQFPAGAVRVVSGKVDYYQGKAQMVNPDFATIEERETLESVEPVYPLTTGITNKVANKAITAAMRFVKPLPEWLDKAHKDRKGWPEWHDAMIVVHRPEREKDLESDAPARERLAYDELLANQLTLTLVRERQKKLSGRALAGTNALQDQLIEKLPYSLTGAQIRALSEIGGDMAAPIKMLRLLQGDVGSGKTVVAALAMLRAVESGCQAALIAPTEILARQHGDTLIQLLDSIGVHAVVLTGRDKGKARDELLMKIADGSAQIVIGTHSLFSKDVEYRDLGLAVIDEQHRFGVQQRLALTEKGKAVDVLVMTATPIPRTLTLTAYGDMDVSRLDEKPPGRKPIDTRLFSMEKLESIAEGLKRQIADGARVYWVCPLVEDSELIDLAAAEARYDILKAHYGDRVGLVHGKMKPAERDVVMEKFAAGQMDILVATTVIEVGVNVPEATIMIIEHAERFGLSQLHQLRGRVGRGGDQSYCFLIYSGPLGEIAKERLTVMRDTEDGFVIAEKDLQLRGAGDVLGVRQSGLPVFRNADLNMHGDLLATARDDAKYILHNDPQLEGERGQAIRTLLYLYECDQAFVNIRSG
jgi:ATP-dependent DNA helicase RecG